MRELTLLIVGAAGLVVGVILIALFWQRFTESLTRAVVDWRKAYLEWAEAEKRAHALLRELLNDAEYEQWTKRGYLEVPSPSFSDRVYHISKCGGRVYVYESGRPVMRLCVQPVEPIPSTEVVVMHKLMIEGNEEEYLKVANRLVGRAIWS
ncbi:MAG: hypothetical protein M1358_02050 [Chloroflexi bacterium]|nr:hypothetical protein [Chloroflexota bacterium]